MAIERVSAERAKELVENEAYAYVDVRSVREFAAGHPAGAYNVPLADMGPFGMAPNPDFVPAMERLFGKDAKLVLGCRTGNRSLRAASLLQDAGFTCVVDQRAGFEGALDASSRMTEPGWRVLGFPVSAGAPEGRSWQSLQEKLR